MFKNNYHVRVNHSLGFYSFYNIQANTHNEAEREAKKIFIDQFCGGKLSTWFRGEETKHTIDTYTLNKEQYYK